jgi:ABC-type transporter Mla maintaining outer membrane lipid asymmetry ATPase subunit MlaF
LLGFARFRTVPNGDPVQSTEDRFDFQAGIATRELAGGDALADDVDEELFVPVTSRNQCAERFALLRGGVLLLDEPSTGLAPVIVNDVMQSLRQINRSGTTVVIVEQNIPATLKLVSRAIVLKAGRIVFDGASGELARKEALWAWF